MRVKRGVTAHRKHKKLRKLTKGMTHARRSSPRLARQAIYRAWQYSYRDRRTRKRDLRELWIIRLNAAVRREGLSYSAFINGLKKTQIELNRKTLAELAVNQPHTFKAILEIAKKAK